MEIQMNALKVRQNWWLREKSQSKWKVRLQKKDNIWNLDSFYTEIAFLGTTQESYS